MVPGGSAQTFRGLLAYLDRCPANVVIYENVDSMDECSGETNMDILLSEFSSRGYEGQRMTLDAHSFGLPQHRRRLWVLLVRALANCRVAFVDREIDQVFASSVRVCQLAKGQCLARHSSCWLMTTPLWQLNWSGVWWPLAGFGLRPLAGFGLRPTRLMAGFVPI